MALRRRLALPGPCRFLILGCFVKAAPRLLVVIGSGWCACRLRSLIGLLSSDLLVHLLNFDWSSLDLAAMVRGSDVRALERRWYYP